MLFFLLGLLFCSASAWAATATTTHYSDGQEGACGCGSNGSMFGWQAPNGIAQGIYTAAGSQALFGSGTWCGSGCGVCYNLTSTGSAPCQTCGTGGGAGQTVTVMVTNLCPNNGNAQWCPNVGGTNQYGYGAHFDINGGVPGWDNPVVNYVQVACPTAAVNDWHQCVCY